MKLLVSVCNFHFFYLHFIPSNITQSSTYLFLLVLLTKFISIYLHSLILVHSTLLSFSPPSKSVHNFFFHSFPMPFIFEQIEHKRNTNLLNFNEDLTFPCKSLMPARSVKCGAATLKKDAEETGVSAMNPKRKTANQRNSAIPFIVAPLKNSLDQYQVLMYPLVTESAMKNMIENNTLVFLVDVRSNKANIKDAFEMICKIRTRKVNTLTTFAGTKKAFIKLGPEYNAIDVAKKFKFI
ncbi:hypothetical protein DCAR_0729674 [Daucus carota subsp. sativus]|uniref:Ribosomal protein L23/L25 N-terminal domain-containing protein n=1 Tax=Daucus carota subsp. sativus TaxID=79200 RepID=A0AAF0XNU1_DAUCS|nr:hypothetical protein DCAR_0729674 [Daucus carota subsp. sativus]